MQGLRSPMHGWGPRVPHNLTHARQCMRPCVRRVQGAHEQHAKGLKEGNAATARKGRYASLDAAVVLDM